MRIDMAMNLQPGLSSSSDESAARASGNACTCVICGLLKKRFSSYSFQEKADLITAGRPTPCLKNLSAKTKQSNRYFNVKIYDNYEWLTACENINKLFCWPCLLFANECGPWNKYGFSDLNNIHKVTKRHDKCETHLKAIMKQKTFGKQRIEHSLSHQLSENHRKHNELVKKNRELLKRFIDVVLYLAVNELSFRGHDESAGATNKGNFMNLLNLLSKYDATLNNHLENSTTFRGTSNLIQNDLIHSIGTVLLQTIKDEINDAPFVAIILDETTDVANLSQLSIVVRYVNHNGKVQERFLGFVDVTAERTAESLYGIVCHIAEEFSFGAKFVAQSYDGAAVMAGEIGGLQAKVKQSFESAMFVHCMAHRLNLVLAQTVQHIKECKIFFSTLSGLAAFFSKSSKRTRALDEEVHKRLPRVAPTRWNYNGRLVQTVHEHRESLITLFENIIQSKDDWDPETLNLSRGYLDALKRDFNFNFLLDVFSEIFPLTDILFNILQSKSNDIGFCIQKIKEFQLRVAEKRNEFERFWETVGQVINLEPPRKRPRTGDVGDHKMTYRRLFNEIMDNINGQLTTRFKNFSNLQFLELCNFNSFKNKPFPKIAFESLKETYGNFFDAAALRSELTVLYSSESDENVDRKQNANELLTFIKENELDQAYSEVLKLCQLVLTMPATSASTERSFSTLKRLKTYIRNSTSEDRLSKLALLSIEKELLTEMSASDTFYNQVISEFAKKQRRIELHYK